MPFGRDFVPDFTHFSVRPDPVAHAHDSEKRFPEEALHAPRAVRFHHLKFGVGQEREIQFVLDLKFSLVFGGIRAAPQDGGICLLELLDGVTKLGRFRRSTGRIRLGIKVQDQILPAVVLE